MTNRVLLGALGSILASACGEQSSAGSDGTPAPETGAGEERVLRVVVTSPEPAEGEQRVVLPGTLEPQESAALHARITGYLGEVAVDIGDVVEEGAVLARIVVPEVRAELARARAEVEAVRAEIARSEGRLELARVTRDRLERLRGRDPGAIPQQDLDEARANVTIGEAELALARNDVQVAEAELQRLVTMSGFATVRAPFAGRITCRVLHPGALVKEGTNSGAEPIVEIARTDPLRLAFDVPEPMVARVREGHAARVSFDAFPGRELELDVARVSGALDERTRSMRAEIELPNPEGEYRPGMYAAVHLGAVTHAGAVVLPSRAVRGRGRERHVLVAEDGVLTERPVAVASDDGRQAIIVAGVDTEDLVMIAGSPIAGDGSRVEPVVEGESEP